MDNGKAPSLQMKQTVSKNEYTFSVTDRKFNSIKAPPMIIPQLNHVRGRQQDITKDDRFYTNSQTGYKKSTKVDFFNFSEMENGDEYINLNK